MDIWGNIERVHLCLVGSAGLESKENVALILGSWLSSFSSGSSSSSILRSIALVRGMMFVSLRNQVDHPDIRISKEFKSG